MDWPTALAPTGRGRPLLELRAKGTVTLVSVGDLGGFVG
jgi:hypothetical protein